MSGARAPLRVLFAAAAGPRLGFGHLVRCRSLARALGVPCVVALHGSPVTRRRARAAGWTLARAGTLTTVRALDLDLLVVDDPSRPRVQRWIARARRAGVPVASVHDLGIAACRSDLTIDGSVRPSAVRGIEGALHGLAYAVLDPRVARLRAHHGRAATGGVLIAVGGGGHAGTVARPIAAAIAERAPHARIQAAAGFAVHHPSPLPAGSWIDAPDGLAGPLARAQLAIVAGGVTLLEACALGVPAVAVALNRAQHVTIRALARRGAVIDAGALDAGDRTVAAIATHVARLLGDAAARRRLGAAGRRLVDGRGALRVAARLRDLVRDAAVRHDVG